MEQSLNPQLPTMICLEECSGPAYVQDDVRYQESRAASVVRGGIQSAENAWSQHIVDIFSV